MRPTDNKPVDSLQLFHQLDDASKTPAALRKPFDPSPHEKITNVLTRRGVPHAADIVKAVRELEQLIRKAGSQRRNDSARSRFDKMMGAEDDAYAAGLQGRGTEQRGQDGRRLNASRDEHRIIVPSDAFRQLANFVVNQLGAAYGRATGGAGRTLSTLQHALVGIQGAALSFRRDGRNRHSDAGGRARVDMRAARSEHKRNLSQASPTGQ